MQFLYPLWLTELYPFRTSKPFVPRSTRNVVIRFFGPRGVSSTPVATNTMKKSACSAPDIKCFDPLIIQSEPSDTALHFIPRTSLPASGSVMANASVISPFTAGRR